MENWKSTSFVKARHSRATRVLQTLNDLSIEKWDKVFNIIHDQSAGLGNNIDLKIELIYKVPKVTRNPKKRTHGLLLSDPITELSDTQRQNKDTRTEKLPSKACNQAKTMQGAKARFLKLLRR